MCQTGYCVLLVLLPLCSLREQEAINIVKKCNVAQPPSPFFFFLCVVFQHKDCREHYVHHILKTCW